MIYQRTPQSIFSPHLSPSQLLTPPTTASQPLLLTSHRSPRSSRLKATSSLAVLTLSYLPGINNLCYNLIIVVGMHFWFNYANDRFFYFKPEAQEDRWRRLSDLSSTQGMLYPFLNPPLCLVYFLPLLCSCTLTFSTWPKHSTVY